MRFTKEQHDWLSKHPPTCYCGKVMFYSKKGYFFCPTCGRESKALAAGANLRTLNNYDLHRIKQQQPF